MEEEYSIEKIVMVQKLVRGMLYYYKNIISNVLCGINIVNFIQLHYLKAF